MKMPWAEKLFPLSIRIYAARDDLDHALRKARRNDKGLIWIGYGKEPDLLKYIEQLPSPKARIRHCITDREMHLHLVRIGVGMASLGAWVQARFPKSQSVSSVEQDNSRQNRCYGTATFRGFVRFSFL